jgi:hypothetical protein
VKTKKFGRYLTSLALMMILTAGAAPLGRHWLAAPAQASGPWNGKAVAFSFTSDDGNRPDNLAWAQIFVARDLSFSVFIPSSWVGWTDRDKLTADDLIQLHLQGIEIGSHGKTHVRLTDISDAQLLDELVGSCRDLEAIIGGDYRCRTIGYPEHAHDLHVMAVVDSLGFTAARDGGSSSQGYPNFSLGKSTWAETSLFELPLTVVSAYLVGTGNSYTEEQTRAQVQALLSGTISSQHYWVNVYAHTLADIDAQHMAWIVDELQKSDAWIANFETIADYYRHGHNLPVPTGVGLASIGVENDHAQEPRPLLGEAFPNPFRVGSSTIPFTLPGAQRVSVRILDLSGRTVRTLLDGIAGPGYQSVRWDGRNDHGDGVPAGIYSYQIQTSTSQEARKLVRLK